MYSCAFVVNLDRHKLPEAFNIYVVDVVLSYFDSGLTTLGKWP